MEKELVQDYDSNKMELFYEDYYRALLRHHKVRLRLFFALQFPERRLDDETYQVRIEQLDFRCWLAESPPDSSNQHHIYQKMVKIMLTLHRSAEKLLSDFDSTKLQENEFRALLKSFHGFDQLSFRLGSVVSKSLSNVDELTGLLNRSALSRDLERIPALTKKEPRLVSIAMIDLDHFKKVNDDFGHLFGDYVLETMAQLFCDCLRPGDEVYRYGGEEFLVLLPETNLKKAASVLERLRGLVCASEIADEENRTTVTVSIGVAQLSKGESPDEAIQRADEALYRAKEAGRNRVVLDREERSN